MIGKGRSVLSGPSTGNMVAFTEQPDPESTTRRRRSVNRGTWQCRVDRAGTVYAWSLSSSGQLGAFVGPVDRKG